MCAFIEMSMCIYAVLKKDLLKKKPEEFRRGKGAEAKSGPAVEFSFFLGKASKPITHQV